MPSPDVTSYVDLTVDDRTAGDLLDGGLAVATELLPGWIPREGQTESVLLEATAAIGADLVFALNRVPAAVVEVLIKVFGVVRDEGAAASTTVQFSVGDGLAHIVPAGTRVLVDLGAAVDPILFATDIDLNIAAGAGSGAVTATADRAGTDGNGTPAGTLAQLVDALAFVNGAQLTTPVGGGLDLESDADYFARALLQFQNLTSALVLAAQFERYALAQPYVFRALAIDLYNPGSGNSPGSDVGHLTIAVLGPGGAAVSAGNKAALAAAATALAYAGLTVHVIDATITAVPITATVRRFGTATSATVAAAVTAALQAYLSTDTWPWSSTVRYNELISLIDGVPNVDFVVSITNPPSDVALVGIANLVTAGAIAITVQDPV